MTLTRVTPELSLPPAVPVTVIIKAYNEERNIATAIEHALRAVSSVGGEVVLADSSSTDSTVELAARYPIRVVTLEYPAERCCGIGPQLGYQHARGEFVYVLDGDMKMRKGFLEAGLQHLRQHPDVAGVGGSIVESNSEHLEYRMRARSGSADMSVGQVGRLDGGGLYRRSAIEQLGYLSNRNLHSYEEFELAARLRAAGWKLERIPVVAADHHGHEVPPYSLLMRRWRSRYACGVGELLRSAAGQPHAALVWRELKELRLYLAVAAWWLLLVILLVMPLQPVTKAIAFVAVFMIPLVAMWIRKRSLKMAAYSVVSWCVNTAGMIRGLIRSPRPPRSRIAARIISDSVQADKRVGSEASRFTGMH